MERLNITTEILDLAEARRRLPLVREQVAIIMEASRELRLLHGRLAASAEDLKPAARARLTRRLHALEMRFRETLKTLNLLGAYLKDPETGLVDFYTWLDGEMVFLCWRQGEADIGWWHGLHEGMVGRKPLPPSTG